MIGRPLIAAAGLGAGLVLVLLWDRDRPEPAPSTVHPAGETADRAAAEVAPGGGDQGLASPAALQRDYPPGARIPIALAPVAAGVRCPDGRHLPLLNGVPAAPPITRRAELGALPPVVAIIVDQRGDKWYEHADGSATTTRYRTVLVDGVSRVDIETVHNARIPDDYYRVRR